MAGWSSVGWDASRFRRRLVGRVFSVFAILLAGILLRALPVRSFLRADSSAADGAVTAARTRPPDAIGLIRLIKGFYVDLNAGRYRQAFERSCEASWAFDLRLDTNRNIEVNRVVGFTPLEALVARARSELGEKGERLSIFDVEVNDVETLVDPSVFGHNQDVRLLSKVDDFRRIEKVYLARVSGQIFATFCAHSRWEKLLVLVRFRDDGAVRIFLNGSGNLVGSRAREWFLDRRVGEYLM